MDLSAVILAGGESRRMGRDKAWLEVDGQPFIHRAIATVTSAGAEEVFISGGEGEDYSTPDVPVLFDLEPNFGPIAGIERALRAASAPLLLVLAVDLPHVTSVFLRRLAARCDVRTGVIRRLEDGLEPLAAIYPKLCHAIASGFLSKNQRTARAFAEACLREHTVRLFRVARADAPCFVNCNTPETLAVGVRAELAASQCRGGMK